MIVANWNSYSGFMGSISATAAYRNVFVGICSYLTEIPPIWQTHVLLLKKEDGEEIPRTEKESKSSRILVRALFRWIVIQALSAKLWRLDVLAKLATRCLRDARLSSSASEEIWEESSFASRDYFWRGTVVLNFEKSLNQNSAFFQKTYRYMYLGT